MDFKKKSLTYYDSSLSDDHDCLKYLRDYLDGEYSKFFQSKIDLSSWKFINEKVVVVLIFNYNHRNPPYLGPGTILGLVVPRPSFGPF